MTKRTTTATLSERGKILHASLALGDTTLLGADVLPDDYERPRGFFVTLSLDDPVDAQRKFQALAEDGTVRMPIQKTFWSPAFGVPWEISCEQKQA